MTVRNKWQISGHLFLLALMRAPTAVTRARVFFVLLQNQVGVKYLLEPLAR